MQKITLNPHLMEMIAQYSRAGSQSTDLNSTTQCNEGLGSKIDLYQSYQTVHVFLKSSLFIPLRILMVEIRL